MKLITSEISDKVIANWRDVSFSSICLPRSLSYRSFDAAILPKVNNDSCHLFGGLMRQVAVIGEGSTVQPSALLKLLGPVIDGFSP